MSRYSLRYILRIGFEMAFALYNALMLVVIFFVFSAGGGPNEAVLLIFFVPLFVLDFLIVPVFLERDWPILKTKMYTEHPIIFFRSCLYFVSIVSIILMFALSFLYD